MKVAIGCDHGGINLKPVLMDYLNKKGIEFEDFGTYDTKSTDYNEYALKVSNAVASGKFDKGILICGTGIGMSIVANKVPGIRCAHCHDTFSAKATRQHNDSNVIAFGERVIAAELMLDIVDLFLNTEFEGGRHVERLNTIKAVESKYSK